MCGIAGFINYDFRDEYFRNIHEIQGHRGPDHKGKWIDENVGLFHQRLSIIDLSEKANQPYKKDHLLIVFNGQIYNYQELRSNLIDKHGVTFDSNSDTEVIVELYRMHGERCLDLLHGMFAFGIYDASKKELFLARDPFGIKPLFYYQRNGRFAFASELKTLVKSPEFEKEINQQALVESLNYLWIPEAHCIFNNCIKLPAGHFLKVDAQLNIQTETYWEVTEKYDSLSEAKVLEKLDYELNATMDRHLVSDVPVHAFLSGGLDSSLISVLAQKRTPLSTYTIRFSEKDKKVEQTSDDARYASKLAEQFGFDHHEIEITPEITSELPHMVYHLDEPIGDPASINTYLICKAARENGTKVLLSGMGADEIFFGYRRQMATLLAAQFNKLPSIGKSILSLGIKALPAKLGERGFRLGRWAHRFDSLVNLTPSEAYKRSYSYYDPEEINTLFEGDVTVQTNEIEIEHNRIFNSKYKNDPINQMCYTDTQMFMQGLNLSYTDRASMAASVEVRVPFIDKDFIGFVMSLPGSLKYKKRTSKFILKKLAERYLPKEIVYRPKASFGAPLRSWISGDLKEMVDDLLSAENMKRRGIFNPIFVQNMIKLDRKGSRDYAYQIYQLLTVELWFRAFMDHR